MSNKVARLHADDPRVIAALNAEQQLFDFYGLKAKTHYIQLSGYDIRMRITEIGSGKPVLIVPGNTGDSFPLASLMAELKDRRLIVLNRPGGGLSEGLDHRRIDFRDLAVKTITTVLDAFALESIPLIGHSIGGQWCQWMAMDRPERVSALILLGVPGNIIGTGPPFALRLLSVPVLNRILFNLVSPKKPDPSLKALTFMGHSPEAIARLPEAMAECYYCFQKLPNYQISSLSLMSRGNVFGARPEDRIIAEQLKRIQQPVMLLWGTNDPFGSVEKGREIAGILPVSQFYSIKGGGHLPWLDEPAECGRLIREFLLSY
jgi:2-hydroxy-6-oxonona-2,4-dienedioate hydrolase